MIVLSSLEMPPLGSFADLSQVAFVPTAANGLDDRDEITRALRRPLQEAGADVVEVDLDDIGEFDPAGLDDVSCVACSGGDPFRLLRSMRRCGFDRALDRVRDRIDYVGMSAGSAVAGTSLAPLVGVSPFEPPVGDVLVALALVDLVPLVHDDRPGRRELHEDAIRRTGSAHRLLPLSDREIALVDGHGGWQVVDVRTGLRCRPAILGDAEGIATTFVEAGRSAWTFVGDERFDAMTLPVESWMERIQSLPDPDDLLVLVDGSEVVGFVWVRAAQDDDPAAHTGEVGAFYTRPRIWGTGAGRRLLDRALDRLRAAGHHTAVLYTEERNERPRRIYERAGWSLDGGARSRDFLGVPIREVRYRRFL